MLAGLKKRWKAFASSRPGERFSDEYERHRKATPSTLGRMLSVGAGLVVTAVGLVMLPAPGPGILVVGFGAALLARESRWLATALDHLEVWLRGAARWCRKKWQRAGWPERAVVIVIGCAGVAGTAWVMYQFTFGS